MQLHTTYDSACFCLIIGRIFITIYSHLLKADWYFVINEYVNVLDGFDILCFWKCYCRRYQPRANVIHYMSFFVQFFSVKIVPC